MKDINLLVINPGSTSTKVAIFENGTMIAKKTLEHSVEQFSKYDNAIDQAEFRGEEVEKFIQEVGYDKSKFTAIVSRGGSLPPTRTGAYIINDDMLDDLTYRPHGYHAASAGAAIATKLANELGLKAYIYDGNTSDELIPVAKLCGIPELKRESLGHFLNGKEAAIRYADSVGGKYDEMTFVVAHMGGGISVACHQKGVVIDILTDEDGPMSPERAGRVQSIPLIQLCFSGKYTEAELTKMCRGGGGLTAFLGTNSMKQAREMADAGDETAQLVIDTIVYQTAKCIGEMATAAKGKVDQIIITGGIANDKRMTDAIKEYVEYIAPVTVTPGEFEMEALNGGITRVLNGEEVPKVYNTVKGRARSYNADVVEYVKD